MDAVRPVIITATQSKMFQILAVLIVMDVVFGCLRALRCRCFNSSIGINGMIRKAGMVLACLLMSFLDSIVALNLIGFIPEAVRGYLPIETVDTMTFFAIIFSVYEVLSVLKNMTLAGLPVDKIWEAMRKFLKENTAEISDLDDFDDEEDKKEEGEEEDGNDEK